MDFALLQKNYKQFKKQYRSNTEPLKWGLFLQVWEKYINMF